MHQSLACGEHFKIGVPTTTLFGSSPAQIIRTVDRAAIRTSLQASTVMNLQDIYISSLKKPSTQ